MKKFFQDPYLKSKIEPSRTEEEKSHYTNEDLGYGNIIKHDKNYDVPQNIFKERVGDTEIVFSYSKPESEEIIADLNKLKDKTDKELVKPLLSPEVLRDIRRVEYFEIKNSDASFTTKLINGQPGPTIYFNVPLQSGSGFSKESHTVFLEEDPLSRKGLMVLFHELGHYSNYGDISDEEIKLYDSSLKRLRSLFSFLPGLKMTEKEAQILLAEERRAWAFALRTLHPFEKDLDLDFENSIETIHKYCLQSYSDTIRYETKLK